MEKKKNGGGRDGRESPAPGSLRLTVGDGRECVCIHYATAIPRVDDKQGRVLASQSLALRVPFDAHSLASIETILGQRTERRSRVGECVVDSVGILQHLIALVIHAEDSASVTPSNVDATHSTVRYIVRQECRPQRRLAELLADSEQQRFQDGNRRSHATLRNAGDAAGLKTRVEQSEMLQFDTTPNPEAEISKLVFRKVQRVLGVKLRPDGGADWTTNA